MKVIEKRTRVRSYEKLCELLEDEPKTNAEERKKQLDRHRQSYIIVKDKNGNGYNVQSRKEPKPDKPKEKKTRNCKYNKYMNGLIMNYLLKGYNPKSYSLIASDLFIDLKFASYTRGESKIAIVKKYGNEIYDIAYEKIYKKIFELVSNSFKSLREKNIFDIKHHVLVGEAEINVSATSLKDLESDIIIEEVTNKMLEERAIKNIHFLNIQGEKVRDKFYKERNEILKEEYGFEVKEKLTYIDIIKVGTYKKYSSVMYKMTCEKLFEQIRNDLVSKLEIYDNQKVNDMYDVLGEGSPELEVSIKANNDNKLLKELYEEYIVYSAQ
jgi:hypothetical protein